MSFRLEASDEFLKDLRKLSPQVRRKIRKQLEFLLQDFGHPSLHTEKIKGDTFAGQDI